MAIVSSENQGKGTVGTSIVEVLLDITASTTKRIAWSITNTSTGAQKVSVALDADPISGQGYVLSPGGSVSEDISTGVTQKRVAIVADLAGGSYAFTARVDLGGQ